MSEYTPTTEEVREYIRAADRVTGHMFAPGADSVEAFDRWLAEVRASLATEESAQSREAKAVAWLEGHAAGRDYQGDGWNSDSHDPDADNPYRAPVQQEGTEE